tara:strand:+ start:2288 stop:2491 length:204 start_codon:yes stop_codon:yes gene_type:complete
MMDKYINAIASHVSNANAASNLRLELRMIERARLLIQAYDMAFKDDDCKTPLSVCRIDGDWTLQVRV